MEINSILVVSLLLTFIGLMVIGVAIPYALWGSALLFTVIGYFTDQYLDTWTGLGFNFIGMMSSRMFGVMSNWVLVAIPMFIFMGLMLDRSGVAEKLMYSAQKLFGNLRGGLAVTALFIGVLMAASTGIVGASVVLLGMLGLPPMLNQGYSKEFSTGTVCASGTLGILIPPSIMLVIFADQLGLSVGDVFLGALIPGLVLSFVYFIYILLFAFLRPTATPLPQEREAITLDIVVKVIREVLPPVFLVVTVLGSIFAGVATVTEASGVGALATVLLTALNRKLSWEILKTAFIGTFQTVGFIAAILVGANFFAIVLRALGGDDVIEHLLFSLPFESSGIIVTIIAAVFFLGFFLDWLEIGLIILPLVGPIIERLPLQIEGYGVIEKPALLWFTILIAVTLQTSFLTPPVGPSIFYLQGIVPPDVKISHIYRGVVPFVILQLLALAIIFVFPQMVTWLPVTVYG